MEVDERLFKQMIDQIGILTRLDVDRRIKEIRDMINQLPGLAEYNDNPYMNSSVRYNNRKYAYEKVAEKLLEIKKQIRIIEVESKNVEFSPEYKNNIDKEIEGVRRAYDGWRLKCEKVLEYVAYLYL